MDRIACDFCYGPGLRDCTKFLIYAPEQTDPSTTTIQRTYIAGTWIEVGDVIECPCGYRFDHWESNDPELNGTIGTHMADFTINENTTATAVFVPTTGTLVVYVDDPTPNSPLPHLHEPELSGDIGHSFWELKGSYNYGVFTRLA